MFRALIDKGKEIIMYVKLVEKALGLLERMAVALETLAKDRGTCTATNSLTDDVPAAQCARRVGHSDLHSTSDGSIRW